MNKRIAPEARTLSRTMTRRRKETRERLIAAALDVFAEVGVRAASVELICDRAGFTRGAFYSNFSKKEELLYALAENEHNARIQRLDRAIQSALERGPLETTEDAVSLILNGFLELHRPSRKWLMLWRELELAALRDSEIARAFNAYQDAAFEKLADMVVTAAHAVERRFVVSPIELVKACSGIFEFSLQESFDASSQPEATDGLMASIIPPLILHLTEPITKA